MGPRSASKHPARRYAVAIHRKDSSDCPNTDEGEVVEARVKLYANGVLYNTYERDMDSNLDFGSWVSDCRVMAICSPEYHYSTGDWQCSALKQKVRQRRPTNF